MTQGRVVYSLEIAPGHAVTLTVQGDVDADVLDALEAYLKQQRDRLGQPVPTCKADDPPSDSAKRRRGCITTEASTGEMLSLWPEVGNRLGLSRNKAYKEAREGRIPVVWFGKTPRVPRRALEEMLAGRNLS